MWKTFTVLLHRGRPHCNETPFIQVRLSINQRINKHCWKRCEAERNSQKVISIITMKIETPCNSAANILGKSVYIYVSVYINCLSDLSIINLSNHLSIVYLIYLSIIYLLLLYIYLLICLLLSMYQSNTHVY